MTEQFSLPLGAPKQSPRVVVFDLETLRGADEVGGWSNVQRMGMACGVCYDTSDGQYHVYEEKDVPSLVNHLRRADLIVGFNHVRFDYKVLSGYSDTNLIALPNLDMLLEIENVLGFRLKLDSLAKATLGETKSADGLQSLRWVKEGRLDLVREYCKKDVEVTKKLFEYGVREGHVVFEKSGLPTQIPVHWNIEKLTQAKLRSR
ncbi:MAG TPA: hypothetical protein VI895_02030 [Bdellovibrionota bacterium]|nr:hypothetical protein [Bdellovibrionota bacterium]